jgi:hypothetical protein
MPAFPRAWAARTRRSSISSVGNTSLRCEGLQGGCSGSAERCGCPFRLLAGKGAQHDGQAIAEAERLADIAAALIERCVEQDFTTRDLRESGHGGTP